MTGWATAHIKIHEQLKEKLTNQIEEASKYANAKEQNDGTIKCYFPGYSGNKIIEDVLKNVEHEKSAILEANNTTDSGTVTVIDKDGNEIDTFQGVEGARGHDAISDAEEKHGLRPPAKHI